MSKQPEDQRTAQRADDVSAKDEAAAERSDSVAPTVGAAMVPLPDLGPRDTQEGPIFIETGQWAMAQGTTARPSSGVKRLGAGSDAFPAPGASVEHGFHEAPTRPDLIPIPDPTRLKPRRRYRPLLLHGPMATARSFESLVLTPEVRPVVEFVERFASQRVPKFNPVFLWSAQPLGKSHLLEAAARRAQHRGRIVLTSATDLEAELERAARGKMRAELRRWLVAADIVIIDDLQRLEAADPTLQALLASVIDGLVAAQSPILLAASRPPAALDALERPLRDRLGGGVVIELTAPNESERQTLLQHFIGEEPVEAGVLELVAAAAGEDLRALRTLANQLLANMALWDYPIINVPLAQRVVKSWRQAVGEA